MFRLLLFASHISLWSLGKAACMSERGQYTSCYIIILFYWLISNFQNIFIKYLKDKPFPSEFAVTSLSLFSIIQNYWKTESNFIHFTVQPRASFFASTKTYNLKINYLKHVLFYVIELHNHYVFFSSKNAILFVSLP